MKNVSVQLEKEFVERFDKICKQKFRTRADMIRAILYYYVECSESEEVEE